MNNLQKTLAGIVATMVAVAVIYTGSGGPIEPIKRTWNSNHYQNEDGTVTASIKAKWVNYLEENDEWQPIDNSFVKTDAFFLMDQAPFIATAPLRSTGMAVFISNNRWDLKNKVKITEEPLEMGIVANGVADVAGKIKTGDLGWGETNYVVYEDAYPDLNADLIYWVHNGAETRLRKLVRFNSDMAFVEDIQLEFDLVFSDTVETRHKDKKWDGVADLAVDGKLSIKRNVGSARGIGLKEAYIWSEGSEQKIDVEYKKQGDSYLLTKIIPIDYLNGAVYPVYTDATFNPDPGNFVDGVVQRSGIDEIFGTIRAGAGTAFNDGAATNYFMQLNATTTNNQYAFLRRGVFLFDTSSIGAGQVVDSATFQLTGTFKANDFSGNIDLVSSNPASNSALANTDYDLNDFGTTLFATSISVAAFDDAGLNTWTLNGSGEAAIDMTGVTKFGTRGSFDTANSAPTWSSGGNEAAFGNNSENGSSEPTLDVTFSPDTTGQDDMFLLF